MKAADLMLDDWCIYKDMQLGDRVVKVKAIYPNKKIEAFGKNFSVTTDELTPIPITEDMLKKNGLKRVEYGVEFGNYKSKDSKIKLIKDFNNWIFKVNDGIYDIMRCEITYVHELQHALYLAKIDKKIKL
ncbi:MAG: hypothetical protein IJU02_07015 [Lachnospiraceae bacterium]|nr:hypothetical protein [Lachnospiraceae bacterium]